MWVIEIDEGTLLLLREERGVSEGERENSEGREGREVRKMREHETSIIVERKRRERKCVRVSEGEGEINTPHGI